MERPRRPNASGRQPDERDPPRRSRFGSWGCSPSAAPVGMHIFVPALPAAAKDLHATPAALELTISLYILGLAVGQLVYGPASDRFGRRPALLVGLSIFTIASVAALFAPDVHTLILARFFQALGGCSGLVLARAIIRDTSQAHEAARRLALTNLLVTAGPAVAPLIGGGLSALWGWRTILVGLSALGVANFVLAWRILPETRPEAAMFVSASRYARDYVGLLRSRQFLGYAIGGACATTSLYAFIACAPFIFVDRLHVPDRQRRPLSRAPGLRALARQPSRKPVDRALFAHAFCGRRQCGQRCGGRFVPRALARRPGDARRNYRDDVCVQRRGGRRGARRPRQGDQREPARDRNSFRTLRFDPDGCRSDSGRARRLGANPGFASARAPRARASWRRRRSGSRETGAPPWPSRKARPRQKRRPRRP